MGFFLDNPLVPVRYGGYLFSKIPFANVRFHMSIQFSLLCHYPLLARFVITILFSLHALPRVSYSFILEIFDFLKQVHCDW